MTLPLTREYTLTSASKWLSSLANKLQDCIVGGKHGSLSMAMPGSGFTIATGSAAVVTPTGLPWVLGTAAARLVAPVRLPVGTTITEIQWRGEWIGATVALQRLPFAGDGTGLVDVLTYTYAGGAWATITAATSGITGLSGALPHQLLDDALYLLSVSTPSGNSTKLLGAKIIYDRR